MRRRRWWWWWWWWWWWCYYGTKNYGWMFGRDKEPERGQRTKNKRFDFERHL